jgi:type IV secretion system protein VirB8
MVKNKPIPATELATFLEETRGLERDYVYEILRSRKIAWRIAWTTSGLTALALLTITALLPLKQIEPFVVRVDNATGSVDVVEILKDGKETTYGEVIDRYWINKYVLNREAYDYDVLQALYDTTGLLSSPTVKQEYLKLYDDAVGRDKLWKNNQRRIVKVKSITPNADGRSATVRFTTEDVFSNGTQNPLEYWVAVLGFTYVKQPLKESERLINPLGFLVTSYRIDPETPEKQFMGRINHVP